VLLSSESVIGKVADLTGEQACSWDSDLLGNGFMNRIRLSPDRFD
jgi:hypothetical protein